MRVRVEASGKKCFACRGVLVPGDEVEQIIHQDNTTRLIHPECTGKRHPKVAAWEKDIKDQGGTG